MRFRLAHVNLRVDDLARAVAFYRDRLGLTPVGRPDPLEARTKGAWFQVGDAELHITEDSAPQSPSRRHVAFEVDDLDALRTRFDGIPLEGSVTIEGIGRFFARDPAGNRLEFFRRTADNK